MFEWLVVALRSWPSRCFEERSEQAASPVARQGVAQGFFKAVFGFPAEIGSQRFARTHKRRGRHLTVLFEVELVLLSKGFGEETRDRNGRPENKLRDFGHEDTMAEGLLQTPPEFARVDLPGMGNEVELMPWPSVGGHEQQGRNEVPDIDDAETLRMPAGLEADAGFGASVEGEGRRIVGAEHDAGAKRRRRETRRCHDTFGPGLGVAVGFDGRRGVFFRPGAPWARAGGGQRGCEEQAFGAPALALEAGDEVDDGAVVDRLVLGEGVRGDNPGEVHHHIHLGQREVRVREDAEVAPEDFCVPGKLLGFLRGAHEGHDVVAGGVQRGAEVGADESGGSGDQKAHERVVPESATGGRSNVGERHWYGVPNRWSGEAFLGSRKCRESVRRREAQGGRTPRDLSLLGCSAMACPLLIARRGRAHRGERGRARDGATTMNEYRLSIAAGLCLLWLWAGCSGAEPAPEDANVNAGRDAALVVRDAGGEEDTGVLPEDAGADGAGVLSIREVARGGTLPVRLSTGEDGEQRLTLENAGGGTLVLPGATVGMPCSAGAPPDTLEAGASEAWSVSLPSRGEEGAYRCAVSIEVQGGEAFDFELSVQVRLPGAPATPLPLRFVDQTEAVLQGRCPAQTDKPWGATFVDWNGDGAVGVAAWFHAGAYPHCAFVVQRDGRMVLDETLSGRLRPGGGWGRHSATNWFAFDVFADADRFTDIIGYGSEVPTGIALNAAMAAGETFSAATVHSKVSYTDIVLIDWDGAGELETIDDFFHLRSAVTGEILRTLHSVPDAGVVGGRGNPGPIVGDFDGDSWPDVLLFFGEDSVALRNNEGTPEPLALTPALRTCHSRLTFTSDFDLDGDLDIACLQEGERHVRMYENTGAFVFEDAGEIEGFGAIFGRTDKSSSAVADLDNDGREELISFGGYNRVEREACNLVAQVHGGAFQTQRCAIYGEGGWSEWCGSPTGDIADYDHDGDLDIVGTGSTCDDQMARLMRNDTAGVYRGLNVRVRYRPGNEGCMGCRIEAQEGGERVAVKFMQMTSSFAHNRTNVMGHLGVGDRAEVDLHVVFPGGGGSYIFPNVATNQTVFVDYAGGTPRLVEGWVPGAAFD